MIRTCFGVSSKGAVDPLLLLSGQVNIHIYLRCNIVGLCLRMLAAKDARVRKWVIGLENGEIETEDNQMELFRRILHTHGVKNEKILFEDTTDINSQNVKSIAKAFRRRICKGEFNRMKSKLIESERCPYLNVEDLHFGIQYSTFLGGKSYAEIHGARIAVLLATNSYYTYSKTNVMAECVICGKMGHKTTGKLMVTIGYIT